MVAAYHARHPPQPRRAPQGVLILSGQHGSVSEHVEDSLPSTTIRDGGLPRQPGGEVRAGVGDDQAQNPAAAGQSTFGDSSHMRVHGVLPQCVSISGQQDGTHQGDGRRRPPRHAWRRSQRAR